MFNKYKTNQFEARECASTIERAFPACTATAIRRQKRERERERERVVAVRDVGCHASERVSELTSSLAYCNEGLHREEANIKSVREVAVLCQYAIGFLICDSVRKETVRKKKLKKKELKKELLEKNNLWKDLTLSLNSNNVQAERKPLQYYHRFTCSSTNSCTLSTCSRCAITQCFLQSSATYDQYTCYQTNLNFFSIVILRCFGKSKSFQKLTIHAENIDILFL